VSRKKRAKKMPEAEFKEVMKREWAPVQLIDGAIPEWMAGIPEDLIDKVMASGTNMPDLSYSTQTVPSGQLIGGIDVYRNAPDDPVDLNKDWYAVVKNTETDAMLLIDGPFKDDEHWLDEIPKRLKGVEILALPRKIDKT
jgi:hypothetical protein